jgi:helicase
LRIDELEVPLQVKEVLRKEGYDLLYPPQEDAIRAEVLKGRNLVLASPTASGKTLIAELCILKNVLEKGGKALYLTPLRALASEKYEEFQKYAAITKSSGENLSILLTTGDYDSSDPWIEKYDIIISTNEKVDSLLRHRARWVTDLCVVVADEVHLLTEPDRGPTLEVVLTRLRQVNPKAQLLALSATVRNAEEVAQWMDATPITTEWRPVPLKEGVYLQGVIQFRDGSFMKVPNLTGNAPLDIALHAVGDGAQSLIFTETRRTAVENGRKAAQALKRTLKTRETRLLKAVAEKILTTGEKTRLSEMLADQVACGAAFHHAGLANVHRRIVEDSFRKGHIKILAATPTLAAGVNLPARTVVISSYERYEPGYGRYPITVLEYKQFCGRAGRPRYDKFGEALLIAKNEDEKEYLMENYVLAKPERLWSKLGVEKVLRPHVLSTVAAGFARSQAGLHEFFAKTFFAHQYDPRAIHGKIDEILRFLYREKMIEIEGDKIYATDFGKRVSELYIDPVSAVIIRDGFYHGARNLTELSFLHLIAHTPDITPKAYPRRRESELLEVLAHKHSDEFMIDVPDVWDDQVSYEEFLAELKCASVLLDWINEATEERILETHRVEPGDLLRLLETADWLLYSSHELAQLFGHKDLLKPLTLLRKRVQSGVKSELVPLVSLEGVGRVRARMLYSAGMKTIEDLKRTSASDLMKVPFIGPAVAKKIKEQVGGKIKPEEWETMKGKPSETEAQRLLSEY